MMKCSYVANQQVVLIFAKYGGSINKIWHFLNYNILHWIRRKLQWTMLKTNTSLSVLIMVISASFILKNDSKLICKLYKYAKNYNLDAKCGSNLIAQSVICKQREWRQVDWVNIPWWDHSWVPVACPSPAFSPHSPHTAHLQH